MLIDIEKLYDYTTKTTINISNKGLDCKEVSKLLLKNRVLSDVITKHSVIKNKETKKYEIENGCLINIYGIKPEHIHNAVWVPLKYEFCLKCCHINVDSGINVNDIIKRQSMKIDGCIKKLIITNNH